MFSLTLLLEIRQGSLFVFKGMWFMKITIIAIGKLKEKYLKDAILEYKKRLSIYCSFEIIELQDESTPDKSNHALEEKIKKVEADRIKKSLRQGSFVIAMDIKGKRFTSKGFAERINTLALCGKSDITFIIGGSIGLAQDILNISDLRFSMSDLTFPHQIVRLILVEQIYRAFKIIRGEPYHK